MVGASTGDKGGTSELAPGAEGSGFVFFLRRLKRLRMVFFSWVKVSRAMGQINFCLLLSMRSL